MLTGNKGEWSEVYALLKVVADRQLYGGDANLNKLENVVLPIVKVLRAESHGNYQYEIHQNIVVITGAGHEFRIPIADFQLHARNLLERINTSTTTSFGIAEVESFITSFNCTSLKANSRVKSDIRIVLHDVVTSNTPELGFSIKSQLGSASTLLNAGKTTNFIYKIGGDEFPAVLVNEINSINSGSKVKDRLALISSLGRPLSFVKLENPIFSNNLTLIDSALPKILSEIVNLFYTSNYSKLKDLVEVIGSNNPLNFDISENHPFYSYKIKRLLTDIALGMMPSRVWSGELEATGGYLVIREDGEVVSYHIYNRNDFEDYLLNNTKLETASTTRHEFGSIYESEGQQFIKLNLQIRFIK